MIVRRVAFMAGSAFVLSCSHQSPGTPAPSSGSGATASAGGRGNESTEIVTLAPRRVPPSRDSLAKLRAVYVAQIMQKIAGRENQPAERVFENIQVLKGITAAQLVHTMDTEYGAAMSWNCTNCHRLAPQGNFASDTSQDKKRARFMQTMVNDINEVELPKLYPKNTPKVSCMTCHRGYNEPPPAEYMIPERGKPGGLPMPTGRGGPPAPARPPR